MNGLTVVLGASPLPDRYSYLAFQTLVDKKFPFALVNPRYEEIGGYPVYADLTTVPGPIETVSMYLSPERQSDVAEALVEVHPRRVLFNPGSENPALKARLEALGIECREACTLVLLRTGQF